MNLLKAKDKMHLRMQNSRHNELLPSVREISDQDLSTCEIDIIDKFGGLNKNSSFNEKNHDPFLAGDGRVGEFPGKSSIEII